jgi:hypothetical protein
MLLAPVDDEPPLIGGLGQPAQPLQQEGGAVVHADLGVIRCGLRGAPPPGQRIVGAAGRLGQITLLLDQLFSSLVTRDDTIGARNSGINVTFVVLGDDASDYLGTGERFALWDGHDLGLGVITRRIFV